ncbi:hypothetical protein [Spirosoma flavum]|uniref:Uncharacterized protein n=1 Tax=Spirosoma flavum TaxID=2048557 RepID=A0ABW6ALD9_9BACT
MSSHEEFGLWSSLPSTKWLTEPLQSRLLAILGQSKPFRQFKEAIDRAGPHRLAWFAFGDKQKIEWLKYELTLAD